MKPTPGPVPGARRAPRLVLEPLEDRTLLSSAGVAPLDNLAVDTSRFNPHDVLVAFRGAPELLAVSPAVVLRSSALDLGDQLYRFDLAAGETVAAALAYFRLQSNVRYAQPDYTVGVSNAPNDPGFVNQWGLNNTGQSSGTAGADIRAAAAWNTITGGSTIVAVIDTGVDYTHPDLAANMWTNTREIPGNGIDDDGDGYVDDVRGWNFKDNNNNPMDNNGHGTHVAGIIGAVGNNGVGVSGVNWRVQIMPLKFLGADGTGSLSDAIRAINFAVAHGATVSNNSYAGGGYYQAYADAVATAAAHGHIVVAAAGNAGTNIDVSPSYPAGYSADNLISVAALDRNDNLASFSNYGATSVDLGAPGVSIYSTLPGNRYGYMNGTSMAAPFVTGAVALVHDLHPTWNYRQIIGDILSNTDPVPALHGKSVTGGRLDVWKALGGTAPTPAPSPPPAPSTPSPLTLYSPDPIKAIPEGGRVNSTLTVNQNLTIGRLSARVNITHPNDGDLKITLTAPWGVSVVLANRRGGTGDNYYTVFDDRSSTPISRGAAPFLGWYKPEQALTTFVGHNAHGTWTLTVEDMAAGNAGKLTGWSITIDGTAGTAAVSSAAGEAIPIVVGAKNENPVWVGDMPPVRTNRAPRPFVVPEQLG